MFTSIINARVKSHDNQDLMIVNTVFAYLFFIQDKEHSCQSVILVLALQPETTVAALNAYLYIESKIIHMILSLLNFNSHRI